MPERGVRRAMGFVLALAASCSDSRQDFAETDIDCGGLACPRCADGKACMVARDCAGGACVMLVCRTAGTANCANAKKDGSETDVDCGGGNCPKCVISK